jgi:hypothetical protein
MKTYCSISHCYTGKDVTVLPVVGVPLDMLNIDL